MAAVGLAFLGTAWRISPWPGLLVGAGALLTWRRPTAAALWLLAGLLALFRISTWSQEIITAWQPHFDQVTHVRGVVTGVFGQTVVVSLLDPRLPGDLEIRGRTLPAGATVTLSCRPYPRSRHLWRDLAKRRLVVCDGAEVKTVSRRPSHWRGWLASWRYEATRRLLRSLRTDPGALAVGLLFGDDDYFSDSLRTTFRQTGTTHLVALSGYNVSIILTITLESFARWLGRRWSTILSLGLLLGFIVVTGAAASVVRAGIMATAVQAAQLLGRPVSPWRPLGLTILLMMIENPGLLAYDVGFQLSVLSTVGLMLFSTPLLKIFGWVPEWFSLRQNLATTMAATLATLPLITVLFRQLSLVSLPVNTVVLPLMPLAMGLAALQAVAASIGQFTLVVTGPIVEVFLSSITSFLRLAARVPGAAWVVPPAAVGAVMILAVSIMLRLFYVRSPADR